MPEEEQSKEAEPRIIVDDDWKHQAQAEKEKLAAEIEETSQGPSEPEQQGPRELPPADFTTLVGTLVTQVLMALRGGEDPKTKKRYVDLGLAKHHIDMLVLIEEKTKGNLSDQEKKLLDGALYEVRMQYVAVAQAATGAR